MPIEVSFDTSAPISQFPQNYHTPSTRSTRGIGGLDSDSSRDALSSSGQGEDAVPVPDPAFGKAVQSCLSTNEVALLREFYPLRSGMQVTVTHFFVDREETHQEMLGGVGFGEGEGVDGAVDGLELIKSRWANRRSKMFLQCPKIRRDGKFTWIAGNTNDLVWQIRLASATRDWVQDDYVEYCRILASRISSSTVASPPHAAAEWTVEKTKDEEIGIEASIHSLCSSSATGKVLLEENEIQPLPVPEERDFLTEGILRKMDSESIWHRELMQRLEKHLRMSKRGPYLEPTARLPLPQKDLTKYRRPLWIVFPFLNIDKSFRSRRLNAAKDILSGIISTPDSFLASECQPRPEIALKRSYDDSDLFPRRLKTPVVDGLPSLLMGRQTLYRFFLPDYDGEDTVEAQHEETLVGKHNLLVDQWWILMPDENCVTTTCTSDDQTALHLSLRVRHPLLLALEIVRQYTQDSINDSFDFDAVMEWYDALILDIGLEQHREFSRLQQVQQIEAARIQRLNRVLDEMKMINHVISSQQAVVAKLHEAVDLFDWTTGRMIGTEPPAGQPVKIFDNARIGKLGREDARRILKEIENNMTRHQAAVQRICSSASSARDIDFQLLNLKQANTNFHESRVVTVFTIVTIIFLPLSFVTSFFGMNVRGVSDDTSNLYSLRYFWLWAGTSCLGVVVLTLLVAFNHATRTGLQRVLAWLFGGVAPWKGGGSEWTPWKRLRKGRGREVMDLEAGKEGMGEGGRKLHQA